MACPSSAALALAALPGSGYCTSACAPASGTLSLPRPQEAGAQSAGRSRARLAGASLVKDGDLLHKAVRREDRVQRVHRDRVGLVVDLRSSAALSRPRRCIRCCHTPPPIRAGARTPHSSTLLSSGMPAAAPRRPAAGAKLGSTDGAAGSEALV